MFALGRGCSSGRSREHVPRRHEVRARAEAGAMTLPVDLARDVGHDLCRKLEEVLGGEEKELRRREVCPGRPREDEALREPKKEDGARGGERQRRGAPWPRGPAAPGGEGERKRIEGGRRRGG